MLDWKKGDKAGTWTSGKWIVWPRPNPHMSGYDYLLGIFLDKKGPVVLDVLSSLDEAQAMAHDLQGVIDGRTGAALSQVTIALQELRLMLAAVPRSSREDNALALIIDTLTRVQAFSRREESSVVDAIESWFAVSGDAGAEYAAVQLRRERDDAVAELARQGSIFNRLLTDLTDAKEFAEEREVLDGDWETIAGILSHASAVALGT